MRVSGLHPELKLFSIIYPKRNRDRQKFCSNRSGEFLSLGCHCDGSLQLVV